VDTHADKISPLTMATRLMLLMREVAPAVADLAAVTDPNSEWCYSILFPLGFFEREIIETAEIIGGICRKTVPSELARVDFNIYNLPTGTFVLRCFLRAEVAPLIEGFGGIIQDTLEGIVVLSCDHGKVDYHHSDCSVVKKTTRAQSWLELNRDALWPQTPQNEGDPVPKPFREVP
jgi:hypothetical protein